MEQQWQKYYQLGQEAQQSSNFVLAFYLKTYACELAVPYHKTLKQQNDPEAGKVSQMLTQTFNELDSMKVQNPNLKNKEQCKQQITAYIQQNIAQVQQSLNQGSYTPQNKLILEKNIAYIDCLHQNGQLPSDLNNLKNVAQQKLVQFNNKPQNNNYDDFGVPDEGGAVRVNQSNISMQNNQQFLNNNSPNNNALNPSQQDAYYQEAFSKLSASKINDMDNKAIQRILEVSNALNQIDNQQNVPQRMPSKINQSQRIKSIYHPPNNDTFNGKNGLPQNDENINQNNGFGMDNNFGTPNPDLLQQSNLKKLNDQQSGGQLYSNINNNNLNQPPSQETGNNYFFKNSQPQNQSQIKPQQPAGIDNFGTPNPDQPFGQWNAPPLPAQNNVQPSSYNNNNNNNFQQPQQPSSFNNNNFNNYNNNNVQPSSFNNNNNNNFNNNNYQPSNFNNNNNNNNPYPFVGQQQPPKQPSVYQQPPPPVVVPQQQQQNKIPEPAPAQTKSYPMTGQKKSNGLIKVQAKKLCEQTVQQMKSGSVEQVKKNLTEAIKLLEEVNL